MTDHTLPERLRELLANATAIHLEFRLEGRDEQERYVVLGSPCCIPVATFGTCDDAALFVAAHQYFPTLLDALDSLSADREAVVTWLRETARMWEPRAGTWMLNEAADAIERGDHLPDPSPPIPLNTDDISSMYAPGSKVPGRRRI